jgi:hypothetical protein
MQASLFSGCMAGQPTRPLQAAIPRPRVDTEPGGAITGLAGSAGFGPIYFSLFVQEIVPCRSSIGFNSLKNPQAPKSHA